MWIELSEFNLKLLIPLIFPVFKRIQDLTKKAYVTNDNQLFKAIRYFTSYTFSFICLIIIYLRTRETKNNKTDDQKDDDHKLLDTIENSRTLSQTQTFRTMSNQIDELKLNISKKNKIKSFLFLALLCLIGFFCYFYRYLFENDEYRVAKQSIGILFDIAGYIILSYFILKQKLYKHSYVSSGIIAFILLILFILSIFHMKREYIFFSFLYYFFYSLSFVTYDILKKKYMNIFFNTPYFMMLVIGITDVVLVLIYDLIVYLVDSDKEGIIKGFQNNITNAGDFFLFFLDRQERIYRGVQYSTDVIERVALTIVCRDQFVDPTVKVILKVAHTGEIGDGRIFVSDMIDTWSIRTGENGDTVLRDKK